MIKKTFTIDMYSYYKIHVIVAEDFDAAIKKYCKGLNVDIEHTTAMFLCNQYIHFNGWILVRPNPATSTIAHEAFHATYKVMSDIGSGLDGESEEPFAYLLGYITDMVVQTLLAYDKKYPAVEESEEIAIKEPNNN